MARATTINGSLPGPTLRFREGDEAIIRVTNELDEHTSLHWHGILLPNDMDGVPKVTFDGIAPGETFEYRYPLIQTGSYWYHSHSGFQEQLGVYGAYIIDPATPVVEKVDREYVVVLSDWTFEDPHRIMARLRKRPDYYNFQQRTVVDFFRDASERGLLGALSDRAMWGGMRMNPTDISDVTGAAYHYLMNGANSDMNWTGLFTPGERVRLRFINASAASYFDVRIPGVPMQVVQVSGQAVEPVETDEIRMATAETYDVIIEPRDDRAYTIFAESMDRSGFVRGTLAPREGLTAEVPVRRPRPTLTMADMGMDHGAMGGTAGMAGMEGMQHDMPMPAPAAPPAAMTGHEGHDMSAMQPAAPVQAPGALASSATHNADSHGAANAMVAEMAVSRLHEPGLGLGNDGWRVLRYTELRSTEMRHHLEAPTREIELHLTGNMERFMWSIDGKTLSEVDAIPLRLGERFRLVLVNDTMMNHPMHLHGMWMELENGTGIAAPKVHTVNVKPAERISLLATATEVGPWAFHCHILYHMDAGMFRIFDVRDDATSERAGAKEGGE